MEKTKLYLEDFANGKILLLFLNKIVELSVNNTKIYIISVILL